MHESLQWGADEIEAHLAANPEVMYRIFGDMYSIVKDQQARANGQRRVGRRPRWVAESLEEMFETIFPEQYSTEPFPEAMVWLLGGQSQRAFAKKVPCHQTTLSRLMAGTLAPDLSMMERIAKAAGVQPSYFPEYRAEFVGEVIKATLGENPVLSIQVLKEVRP